VGPIAAELVGPLGAELVADLVADPVGPQGLREPRER